MGDVWRAEVYVPEVILLLPDPSVAHSGGLGEQYADAAYAFQARDLTREYTIQMFVVRVASGGGTYETRANCTVFNSVGPSLDFTQTLTASGTGTYEAGGLLAIEKDQDQDQVRFITPGGNVTAVPSTWSGNDNLQMRPIELQNRLNLRVPRLSAHQNTVDWNHFFGSQNGTKYMGAPMAEDQPGTWVGWAADVGSPGTPPHATSFVQQPTSFRSQQSATLAGTYGQSLEQYIDQWAGGDTLPKMILPAVELARSDEHGVIWAVYTTSMDRDTLFWRRSHDGGATWTIGTVDQTDGQVKRNPQLYWYGGRLVALWTNGTAVYQSFSSSFGEYWEGPSLVGFDLGSLANNPRLRVVCDRHHGVAYYFARANDNALVLLRSYDSGETFGDEVTVHAGIDDAILDATITQDSRIHVRFSAGGYETRSSSSWGEHWDVEAAAVGLGTNPRSSEDGRHGWTYHVNWVALGTSLFGYGDPDFGLVAANFETIAGPGLAEQVADVEVRPDGAIMVAYWAAGEVLSFKRSFDFSNTFETF